MECVCGSGILEEIELTKKKPPGACGCAATAYGCHTQECDAPRENSCAQTQLGALAAERTCDEATMPLETPRGRCVCVL